MDSNGYYKLGTIARTHGVKGNLVIALDVDDPSKYKKIKAVFLPKDGLFSSYKVTSTSLLGDNMIVHLEGIEDMTSAENYVRKEVFLPLEQLPKLPTNKVYFHEAVGMMVIDKTEGELGKIERIYDLPEQPMASVKFNEKELLFPLISVFIEKVDRDKKELHVNLPEGLIDIYR